MKDKHYDNYSTETYGEHKENKYPLSKYDYDLYDVNKAIPGIVIRVKRIGSVAKNERWRIFQNDELKFVIESDKLSKKECVFLRSIEGTSWLISEFKTGFKSLHELRCRLKKKI